MPLLTHGYMYFFEGLGILVILQNLPLSYSVSRELLKTKVLEPVLVMRMSFVVVCSPTLYHQMRCAKTSCAFDQRQKKISEWDVTQLIEYFKELFTDRDATAKAKLWLKILRQGPHQPLAKFRNVFEQLCPEADGLAPTHASKMSLIMRSALVSSLRKGIAYRPMYQ